MLPVIVIILLVIGLGFALWIGKVSRVLGFAETQVAEAWADLRMALANRREMVPYIVAAVPSTISLTLDVIGNACDLAANVSGVRDSSQAEGRLSAAINRLFSQLDADAAIETRELLLPLREQMKDLEARIAMLKELYDHQGEVFNALLKQGAGRILVSVGVFKPKEMF